jgi:hypothetical protein
MFAVLEVVRLMGESVSDASVQQWGCEKLRKLFHDDWVMVMECGAVQAAMEAMRAHEHNLGVQRIALRLLMSLSDGRPRGCPGRWPDRIEPVLAPMRITVSNGIEVVFAAMRNHMHDCVILKAAFGLINVLTKPVRFGKNFWGEDRERDQHEINEINERERELQDNIEQVKLAVCMSTHDRLGSDMACSFNQISGEPALLQMIMDNVWSTASILAARVITDKGLVKVLLEVIKANMADGNIRECAFTVLQRVPWCFRYIQSLVAEGGIEVILDVMRARRGDGFSLKGGLRLIADVSHVAVAAEMVVKTGGLEHVLDTMRAYQSDEKVQYQGCDIIRNLLQHTLHMETVVGHGGIQEVVAAMKEHDTRRVVSVVCTTLKRLAVNTENIKVMLELGVVELVVDAMHSHEEDNVAMHDAVNLLNILVAAPFECTENRQAR